MSLKTSKKAKFRWCKRGGGGDKKNVHGLGRAPDRGVKYPLKLIRYC